MTLKKIITSKLLFIASIAFTNVFAQQITTGETFKTENYYQDYKLITKKDNNYIVFKSQNAVTSAGGTLTEKAMGSYNNKLSNPEVYPIKLDDKNMEMYDDVFYINDKLYGFFTKYDKSSNQNIIYGSTLTFNGQIEKLTEVARIEYNDYTKPGVIDVRLSENEKSFLIIFKPDSKHTGQEKVDFIVSDLSFNALDKVKIALPIQTKNVVNVDYILDEKGNIYFLNFEEKPTINKKEFPCQFKIYAYSSQTKKIKDFVVMPKLSSPSHATIRLVNNELVCTGLYTKNEFRDTDGTFLYKINTANMQVTTQTSKAFSKEILSKMLTELDLKKEKPLRELTINSVYTENDGSMVIVFEQVYLLENNYFSQSTKEILKLTNNLLRYNNGGRSVSSGSSNQDVLIIKMDQNGDYNWWKHISKYQDTGASGGFAHIKIGDKFHFIYNDHPKNKDIISSNDKTTLRDGYGTVVLVTIDPQGKDTKKTLFKSNDSGTFASPRDFFIVNDNEIVFKCGRVGKVKLISVKF